jgi:hypothetical protein
MRGGRPLRTGGCPVYPFFSKHREISLVIFPVESTLILLVSKIEVD